MSQKRLTKTIQSPSNETFKSFLSLTTAKGLKKEGLFLLSGKDLVSEYLNQPPSKVPKLIAEIVRGNTTGGEMASVSPAPVLYELLPALFDELDVIGTHSPILVLEQPEIHPWEQGAAKGIEVILPLGDPGNLGACIRSCEAFGASSVILAQEAAHPFLPKSVKASAGSVYRMKLKRGPQLKDIQDDVHALDARGKNIYSYQWPKDLYLLVGEEGAGLRFDTYKNLLSIPIQSVESLNATVSVSLALFHYRSQFSLRK